MESIFLQYIQISLIAGLLILFLFLSAPLLNRHYAAKWKYLVWLFLAVWLLVPVKFSIQNAPIQVNVPYHLQENILENTGTILKDNTLENEIEHEVLNLQKYHEAELNNQDNYDFYFNTIQMDGEKQESEIENGIEKESQKESQIINNYQNSTFFYSITFIEMLWGIWIIGIVYFVLYHSIMHFSYRKNILRFGRLCDNQEWLELYEKLCRKVNIQRKPAMLMSKKAHSPMIIGLIRPKLVLPEINYSIVELQYILSHELVHYRRKDLWYKLLLLAANAVHWFNPLVYLMFREASGDLECFCDDAVVKEASFIQRRDYTETILNNLTRQKINEKNLSTYFYGGSRRMKNRFQNILNTGRKKSGRAAFILFLCGSLCIGSLIACVPSQEEEVITSEEEQNQTEVMSTDLEKQKDLEAQEKALEELMMQQIEQEIKEKKAALNEINFQIIFLEKSGELTEENKKKLQDSKAKLEAEIENLQSLLQKNYGMLESQIEYYDKRFILYESDSISFYYPMSWNYTVEQKEDNNNIVFVNQAVSTDETIGRDEIFRISQGEGWHVDLDVTAQQYEEMWKETYPDIKVIRMSDTMIDNCDAVEIIFAYSKNGERYFGVEYQTIVGYASFRFFGTCLKENEQDFKNIVAGIVGTVNFITDSPMNDFDAVYLDYIEQGLSFDALEVQKIVKDFSECFFNGDIEGVKKYLWENFEWEVYVNEEPTKLLNLKRIKGLSKIEDMKIGDKCHVSLEYVKEDDDSNTYLEIGMIKTEGGWKITNYGIEK